MEGNTIPSIVVGYVPGSGFTALFSGNPWSGRIEPIGGCQLIADPANSGAVYISLSGANAFSGQASTLVGSGGPTINSGTMYLSGGISSGLMDGLKLAPGAAYFPPRICFLQGGVNSGSFNLCAGADPACSGQFARIYIEMM